MRLLLSLLAIGSVCAGEIRAADPVMVELRDRAVSGTSVVTLGQVALISGGDELTRAKLASIDVAELKSRLPSASVGRRAIEYRLILAGFDANSVRVIGAERTNITMTRRVVTVEEITAAAKAELFRHISSGPETVMVELAFPVVVKLPEVPADERPVITAKPHGRVTTQGRVQMDISISFNSEPLLSLAVYLDVKTGGGPGEPVGGSTARWPGQTGAPVTPAGGTTLPASTEVLIRPRQRVTMEVHSGGLTVKAVGEAQQQGRLGDSILVQNVDSKKAVVARVTGPSTVEVDIGGAP